jgi:methylase of polypeptide subunit release factors
MTGREFMPFESFIQKLIEHRDGEKTVQSLKNYLDSIEYHYIYKYLSTIHNYYANVSVFSLLNSKTFHLIDAAMEGRRWSLAKALTTHCPCPLSDLTEAERELAYLLCEVGVLSEDSGKLIPGDLQLLSTGDKYLLIDAAIHFLKGRIHEIYIGNDTLMMLYYMGLQPGGYRTRRGRALDICSGTGILGLFMTNFADVTATDISPAALSLISVNAALNGVKDKISILAEDMRVTLDAEEAFDTVTCNPPFVAFPENLPGPLYAEGVGRDGLDYLRLLLEKTPRKLKDGGMGFFVADLPGDDFKPYFLRELERYAGDVTIDAYVDGNSLVSHHVEMLSPFIARMHPDRTKDSIREEFSRFARDVLNAKRYHLTTIRITKNAKNGGSGVRIFNRFGGRKIEKKITRYDQLFQEGHEK